MRVICIFLIFFFYSFICFSQGEFNNWYFGNKAGVSFNSGFPVVFTTSQMNGGVGGSENISDSLGNILFYTMGFTLYNSDNNVMPNGWAILGGSLCAVNYMKIAIAFQRLDDGTKYYLMHWSDLSADTDTYFVSFLGCDKYLIWGDAHKKGFEGPSDIYLPTGFVFKGHIKVTA